MSENTNKAYDEAINYLKTSPMFNLSLSSNELFHSNYLYWIWKTNEDCFKKIINSLIGEENYWDKNWKGKNLEVRREYKNFDLSIVEVLNSAKTEQDIDNKVYKSTSEPENESENGEYRTDGLILFVLENKIKSIPYKKQIDEYINKISTHNSAVVKKGNSARTAKLRKLINDRKNQCRTENIEGRLKSGQSKEIEEEIRSENKALNTKISTPTSQLVLLSLVKDFPDKPKEHEWKIKSYEEYIEQIESLKFTDYNNLKTDYCQYVRNLITCIKKWDKFPKFYIEESDNFLEYPHLQTAEELRLHALYSKYNYAKLCCILMQKLKEKEFGKDKVQYIRKQDDIMLLTGQDPKKKSQFGSYDDCFNDNILIGVGYDYTSTKPLLEVKVVRKPADADAVKLIYIIQVQGDKYEHGIIKKGTRSEVESFITCNELKWVDKIEGGSEIFGDNEVNNSYNGYNDTYSMVYKYRQITDKAETKKVIEYIISDVKNLLAELDKQQ